MQQTITRLLATLLASPTRARGPDGIQSEKTAKIDAAFDLMHDGTLPSQLRAKSCHSYKAPCSSCIISSNSG